MEPELRVISRDDWQALRRIRLRALADSPDSFSATLAQAEPQAEGFWQARAGGPDPVLIAFAGDGPAAMGGLFVPADATAAYVWGMWVAPEWRGHGLGTRILQDLVERAEALGRQVKLHVTEGNQDARRLYTAHGFEPTGEWQPLREGSGLRVEEMRRP